MICISSDQMTSYLLGRLDDHDSSAIEQHLGDCRHCEQLARQLEREGDSLTSHLRLEQGPFSADAAHSADPDWSQCLARLSRLPQLDAPLKISPARPPQVYHYRLEEVLGHGGMGVVYRSQHPQLHRPVAVKVLSAARAADEESIQRFQLEMRAAGQLDHPGIVRAVDAGVWEGTYYLVMELIDGINLAELVRRLGPLDARVACALISAAADAIAYAHQRDVIHRDIKPSNILLSRAGEVKVLDFGLARLEHGGLSCHDETTAGRLIGTLDYIAPEQATGQDPIDSRVDTYGLGATLYWLLSGKPPHGRSKDRPILDHLQRVTGSVPQPLEQLRADLPPELCQVVGNLLERSPRDRPSGSDAIARLLAPWAAADLGAVARDALQAAPTAPATSHPLSAPNLLGVSQDEPRAAIAAIETTKPSRRMASWLVAAGLLLAGAASGAAGLTFWLNSGDGVVRIDSEVDQIQLQLIRDGRVAQQIEVRTGADQSVVRVGTYEVKIAGATDHVRYEPRSLSIMRGQQQVVRITREPAPSGAAQNAVAGTASTLSPAPMPTLTPDTEPAPPEETHRGRTLSEWSDLVRREQDHTTLLEGIQALGLLSNETTHWHTFQTLADVIAKNEAGSASVSDDYATYHQRALASQLRVRAQFRGETLNPYATRQASRSSSSAKQLQPIADRWTDIVSACVLTLKELPARELSARLLDSTEPQSDSAKRLLLAASTLDGKPATWLDVPKIVDTLAAANQPDEVRACAIHIQLTQLKQQPTETHRQLLSEGSPTLSRAVYRALWETAQYPFPAEQAYALAQMSELANQHRYQQSWQQTLLAVLRQMGPRAASLSLREAKAIDNSVYQSAPRRFLAELLDAVARQMPTKPTAADHFRLPLIRSLANLNMVPDRWHAPLAHALHERLAFQLEQRVHFNPSQLDNFENAPWVKQTVEALLALEGKLPPELETQRLRPDSELGKQFAKWQAAHREFFVDNQTDVEKGRELQRDMHLWALQFPLETTEHLLEIARHNLKDYLAGARDAARGYPRRGERWTQLPSAFHELSPDFAAAILMADPSEPNNLFSYVLLGAAASTLDHGAPNEITSHLQTTLPLTLIRVHYRSLIESTKTAEPGWLHWVSYLAGAPRDQLASSAFELATRATTDDQTGELLWATDPSSIAWSVSCLAALLSESTDSSETKPLLSREQLKTLNELGGASLRFRSERDVSQFYVSMLELNAELGPDVDPQYRILLTALGKRSSGPGPPTRTAYPATQDFDEEAWRRVAHPMPVEVFRAAMDEVIQHPPTSQEVLDLLRSRSNSARAAQVQGGTVRAKFDAAIAAVSEKLGQTESSP
ncbi:MAG: serine/threonine protein kinase [Planctomycetales bacterium]|nr:serine/threonine protein kinase [Planctomycetales bacterium]